VTSSQIVCPSVNTTHDKCSAHLSTITQSHPRLKMDKNLTVTSVPSLGILPLTVSICFVNAYSIFVITRKLVLNFNTGERQLVWSWAWCASHWNLSLLTARCLNCFHPGVSRRPWCLAEAAQVTGSLACITPRCSYMDSPVSQLTSMLNLDP
jgi:hypothetical protein